MKLTIGAFSAEWGSYAGVAGGTVAVAAAAEAIIHERRNRERRRTPGADVVA
jgi:hypothetical protein